MNFVFSQGNDSLHSDVHPQSSYLMMAKSLLFNEAVDQYALEWAKREMVELSVLSSWNEMLKGRIEERISKLKQNFKQPTGKVLQNADVKACLCDQHNKYVFVPADKAPNNIYHNYM